MRAALATLAAAVMLVVAAPSASAMTPALRGTVPLVEGWPKCVTTAAGAARLGVHKTPRGALCAARLVATPSGQHGTEYVRKQPRTESWPYLGLIVSEDGQRLVADLVRRPR